MTGSGWRIFDDPVRFLEAVGPMDLEQEAMNRLPLAICRRLSESPTHDEKAFLYLAREGRVMTGAAVRTPGRNIVLLSGPRWGHVDCLMLRDALISAGVDLPGVFGPFEPARSFSAVWCDLMETVPVIRMQLGAYILVEVRLAPGPGALVQATSSDADFFWEWEKAFSIDCYGELQPHFTREAAERLLASGEVFFWVIDGEKVSMASSNRTTERGAVVYLVYTPPALRGRGYASSVVAALTKRQLDSGLSYCTLFADIANPVSNSIYQRIGYEFSGRFTEIAFENGV
ncbi:MAG TPA: GNAT family N-acetyltransferase [Candidatus Fermentibacter daniensis]|nr:GNAT family N-acetyltransferase [Candidatus Fermentibacter daniensis]HOR07436.1 GNAT family N-acetyltransferase [Candidatus Fermentibacter daniensis]HPK52502.1 GNAT family N-acetyltransferase [Candidatus Fermentibacter daniensis]